MLSQCVARAAALRRACATPLVHRVGSACQQLQDGAAAAARPRCGLHLAAAPAARQPTTAAASCQAASVSATPTDNVPLSAPTAAGSSGSHPTAAGAASQPAIQLWPAPSGTSPPLTTTALIRHFVARRSESGATPRLYSTGGLLVVDNEDDVPADRAELTAVARLLAKHLNLRLFTHHSTKQLDDATTVRDGELSTMGELEEDERPVFLLILESDRVSATVLRREGRREDAQTVTGGVSCVTLDDAGEYKRRGAHGYDAASPLVRACFGESAAAAATAIPGEGQPPAFSSSSSGPRILDVTMGAGIDSFLLASFGARVSMIEQDVILALLMMDGLRRASLTHSDSPSAQEVVQVVRRLTLLHGDAVDHLRAISETDVPPPDVIYADPFYPDPPPSELADFNTGSSKPPAKSRSKKSMELARCLWRDTQRGEDGSELSIVTPPPAFHPSRANFALHALLCIALSSPASTHVVLKQPATPYARRLVVQQMPFRFRESFAARDTIFHRVEFKPQPQTTAATVESSPQPKGVRMKAPSGKKKSKGGRRSFHSDAFCSQPHDASLAPDLAGSAHASSSSSAVIPGAYTFSPIGTLRSVLRDKFAIPRQSSLASSATGVLTLDPHSTAHALPNKSWTKSVDGLADFSHVWLVFIFHQHETPASDAAASAADSSEGVWKQTVRPPRLGGAHRVGVFASRSPYRPCAIGMSAVKLERVLTDEATGRVHLHFSGVDLLDGTPILDVKPYIPYCDSLPSDQLRLGWADQPVPRFPVRWDAAVERQVASIQSELDTASTRDPSLPRVHLRSLIHDLLALDPRHGYQQHGHPVVAACSAGRRYGFQVLDWNVAYVMDGVGFVIEGIETMEEFRREKDQRRKGKAATNQKKQQ